MRWKALYLLIELIVVSIFAKLQPKRWLVILAAGFLLLLIISGVPKTAPKPTPPPAQNLIREERRPKEESGPKLPKALLPTIHIGPSWTINGDTARQSGGQADPSAQVPPGFIGRWTGKVIQTGSAKGEYEVDVAITSGRGSVRVGTASYITVSWMGGVRNTAALCSADLYLVSATDMQVSVEERLTKGKANCIDRTLVNLTRNLVDGTLEYSAGVGDLSAKAVLRKVEH